MFGIFKRKAPATNGKHDPNEAERRLDDMVEKAKRSAEELVEDIHRARQKRLLKEALNGD
jgi:hypothetical protein